MENLSEPAETIAIPVTIAVRAYLGDHHVSGRVVLPAVEALRILAGTLPPTSGADPRQQEAGRFSHLLTIPAGEREISAIHEFSRYADGRCRSRLVTVISGRQASWTRKVEHASVFFLPEGGGGTAGEGKGAAPLPTSGEAATSLPGEAVMRPLHDSSIRHSGLDPESRKRLMILDSVFRRNDETAGFMPLCKGLVMPIPGEAETSAGPVFAIPARRLYEELVPFGPAYQNVVGDLQLTAGEAWTELSGGDHPEAAGPLGSPFPFDAALHAACVWGQRYRGIVAFPVGFDRREIACTTRAGETYCCRVVPLAAAGGALRFDILIAGEGGRPAEVIQGVSMRDISGGRRKPPAWVREGVEA